MPRASLVLREKAVDESGNIVEAVVWRVAVTTQNPSGVRYRLAFIRQGDEVPIVLYDNHSPKGHHRHIEGVEAVYDFVSLEWLLGDFTDDVRRFGGPSLWAEH